MIWSALCVVRSTVVKSGQRTSLSLGCTQWHQRRAVLNHRGVKLLWLREIQNCMSDHLGDKEQTPSGGGWGGLGRGLISVWAAEGKKSEVSLRLVCNLSPDLPSFIIASKTLVLWARLYCICDDWWLFTYSRTCVEPYRRPTIAFVRQRFLNRVPVAAIAAWNFSDCWNSYNPVWNDHRQMPSALQKWRYRRRLLSRVLTNIIVMSSNFVHVIFTTA